MIWKLELKCKFCKILFTAYEEDIHYEDLRMPTFFVPDYQFFVVCPACEEKLIQSKLPSDVAIRVQNRSIES